MDKVALNWNNCERKKDQLSLVELWNLAIWLTNDQKPGCLARLPLDHLATGHWSTWPLGLEYNWK